jgi:hypothetical protein
MFVAGSMRSWIALVWIWGPTLWFFPGILWIGVLELPALQILVLSFCLPLTCYVIFMLFSGLFPLSSPASSSDKQTSVITIGLVALITGFSLLNALLEPELSLLKFGVFVATVLSAPLLSVAALVQWASKAVPVGRHQERPLRRALKMLFGFFSTFPKSTWVVEEGTVHPRIQGNAFAGAGPGWLMTEPENTVILKAGPKVTRVAGPGIALTDRAETPFKVVDLRNQIRTTQINAITRDGIEVRVPVSSLFRVNRGYGEIILGESWPYRHQRDVFGVAFSEEVDPTGKSPLEANTAHPWGDLPLRLAAHRTEQAISFYSLDQLYSGITDPSAALDEEDPQFQLLKIHRQVEKALGLPKADQLGDPLTRTTIGGLVRRSVRQTLEPRGYEILGGSIGNKITPLNQEVTAKRVEAWKSRFILKVMDWHANVNRERFTELETVRQSARDTMLDSMIKETQEYMADADEDAQRDYVAYHLLDRLIRMARDPEVREMLPESALPTLEDLYRQVTEEEEL